MAGRFPILTDACVNDHLAQALEQRGWDVKRAIDLYPEKTKDEVLFERVAKDGRVFVTNDRPAEAIAIRWLKESRAFRGMVAWLSDPLSQGSVKRVPSLREPGRHLLTRAIARANRRAHRHVPLSADGRVFGGDPALSQPSCTGAGQFVCGLSRRRAKLRALKRERESETGGRAGDPR